MNRSITLSVKGLLVVAVVALALMAAFLVGARGVPPAQGQAPVQAQDHSTAGAVGSTPTLRMTGRGTATAVPDQLSFSLTATAKRTELQDALAASTAAMRRAQQRLADFGVEPRDLSTTGLQMYPEYDYPSSGPAVLTGYRVTQRARVRIGDPAEGGRAIAAVVRSGAARVTVRNIRLEVGDPDAALARARDAAVAEARAKAEQYAAAAGVNLGQVTSIQEISRRRPTPVALNEVYRDVQAARSVPIRAGEKESAVTVEIVWSVG